MKQAERIGVACLLFLLPASAANAVTQFNWNSGLTGNQIWGLNGNWNLPNFPNASTHVANLSGPLAANLDVSLTTNDYTVAGVTMGGTSSPIATSIENGTLLVRNDDAALNNGNAVITSAGVAGSTNAISAPLWLQDEPLELSAASTNDLQLGAIVASGANPAVRNFMPAGVKATINVLDVSDPDIFDNYRRFRINDLAFGPEGVAGGGTLEIREVVGYGELSIGATASSSPIPLSNVILSGANFFTGYVQLNRANVVLANDYALGQFGFFLGQPNQGVGFNLLSNHDARTVYATGVISQWLSIRGEHSLTFANVVAQSNSRGTVNLLPAGKTVTFSGGLYAVSGSDTERTFSFDGTGRTLVTGGLHDKFVFETGLPDVGTGHVRKTGTGSVYVSGVTGSYHGTTIIEAGTLRFSSAAHLANTSAIVSTGGALGVDTGIFSDAAILAKIDAADTGGLMLTPGEAAANLDFTSGPLANAANVSVAAPEAGINYVGTITPANSTYRLGGGSGVLTLPNQNQLTGNNHLVVANGGVVRLTDLNDYTGTTTITDNPFVSRTDQAVADRTSGISTNMFAPTTLEVTTLKSGGVESSIGTSSNDASNLVIQGSTLRHVGAGDKIHRLFTIGTRGATIESVGPGRLFFENVGALAIVPGGASTSRTLTLTGDSPVNGMHPLIQNAPDGGVVGLTKSGTGEWELHGDNTYSGPTLVAEGRLNVNGTQTGGGAYNVSDGATLGGTGTVGGDVNSAGVISPGRSVGALAINGNLALASSGIMEIEITDNVAGEFDVLHVSGTAALEGMLRVTLPNQVGGPYVPTLGDEFPFLVAQGGASVGFGAFDLPVLGPGLAWTLTPGAVTVSLNVVAALPGDYNFNGIVDAADYTVWRDSLGQTGVGLVADGDDSEVVDELDYALWQTHFGETLSGSGQLGILGSNVPEPNCLFLLCLSSAAWSRWRRR